MDRDPSDLIPAADTPAGFLAFLAALRADLAAAEAADRASPPAPFGPGARGWENGTLAAFLEAIEAYAADAEVPLQPSWRTVAQLLLAGKGYE